MVGEKFSSRWRGRKERPARKRMSSRLPSLPPPGCPRFPPCLDPRWSSILSSHGCPAQPRFPLIRSQCRITQEKSKSRRRKASAAVLRRRGKGSRSNLRKVRGPLNKEFHQLDRFGSRSEERSSEKEEAAIEGGVGDWTTRRGESFPRLASSLSSSQLSFFSFISLA